MRTSRRFIPVFLLSLILVFNLCAIPTLGAEPQNTYQQSVKVMASAKKAASPTINKTSYTMVKGQTYTLKINNTKSRITWSSSNTNVASVNKSGKVYAKKNGKAIITAKVGSKKLKCTIKVETPRINYTSLKLTNGSKKTLKLSGNSQKIYWSSSNKSIATVSSKGYVVTKKTGTVVITAKVTSGKKYTCKITIYKPAVINTVYITKSGRKYHRANCKCLKKSKIAISLKDAKARGYKPCSICFH